MTSVAMVKFNLAWWVEVSFTYTLHTIQVSLKSRGIRNSWKLTSSKKRLTKMSSSSSSTILILIFSMRVWNMITLEKQFAT